MTLTPYYDHAGIQIINAHVLDGLKGMEPESIQCCVTSPPYWGLRDYGLEPQIWDGEVDCVHEWGEEKRLVSGPHSGLKDAAEKSDGRKRHNNAGDSGSYAFDASQGQFCQRCGAWRGSLGLEPTPELFVSHLVQIFREVRRVLRKDGILFLNLGDSYAGSWGDSGNRPERTGIEGHQRKKNTKFFKREGHPQSNKPVTVSPPGLKPKDLCMIPARVALALQADGWWLRSAMPWVKRSAMPESVTDRPANALEHVFLLSKSQKYYFDMESVRVGDNVCTRKAGGYQKSELQGCYDGRRGLGLANNDTTTVGRNFRNTDLFYQSIEPPHGLIFCGDEMVGLDVNPQPKPTPEAHFATFPDKLVEPCILAGTSQKGCCPDCGSPWERVVEKVRNEPSEKYKADGKHFQDGGALRNDGGPSDVKRSVLQSMACESKTIGWKPTCKCKTEKTVPCSVLDCFGGSCTVARVAKRLGRKAVLIELNPNYCEMPIQSLAQDRLQFGERN